jgi:SAM-dependent methyltransferase
MCAQADILIAAAESGRRRVIVDDGAGMSAGFADDLAAVVRFAGADCVRRSGDGDPDGPSAGLVLVDGGCGHEGSRDVVIYLRTPRELQHGNSGDGEFGADIVIDHHPRWPVIRHVSSTLEHEVDRIYLSEKQAFFAPRAFTWNEKFGADQPAYEQAVVESGVPVGATVVDVGCGTGRALPALRGAAGRRGVVIGVDVKPEMLTIAWQVAGQSQLLMADARRLPLADASADVVFAAGLVQHLPDPGAGLAELARITRAGGRLIIFHPSGRAALAARHGRMLAPDEPLAHGQLERLLRDAGWRPARYDDPPHRFYALAARVA